MLPVRTNNDIEGWQHLKQKIRQQGAPSVLPVGGAVTSRVPPGVHPNPTGLRREAVQDPAKKFWQLQERVFKHWEDFNCKEISARRLLKLCS